MTLFLSAIDTGALAKVVAASLVAGAVVVMSYSLCLYGADVYVHERRAGKTARAVPYAVLATVSGLVFAAAVVVGVIVMTTK